MNLSTLSIKIFADTGDPLKIAEWGKNKYIAGFTTNPSLIRKAGMLDYRTWAEIAVETAEGRPISIEVLADDFDKMEVQARTIASWGDNIYVKIPIVNTLGKSATGVIQRLSKDGIKVNVTACTTVVHAYTASMALCDGAPSIISIFAGRVADAGYDPVAMIAEILDFKLPSTQLLWASTREVYNIIQANNVGCDIITAPEAVLTKLNWLGRDLHEICIDTVKQFREDAMAAGYEL